jgi:hypothetical protein
VSGKWKVEKTESAFHPNSVSGRTLSLPGLLSTLYFLLASRLFENQISDLVAIAQWKERPVVNRKVMGSTPIGGVTWI